MNIEDHMQINRLINHWMFRDLGQWDKMHGLFHEDGEIEVTWFKGKFTDFIEASIHMADKSSVSTKHMIGAPVITFNGRKAIAETNAMIIGENAELGLGASTHNRFYDLVEKREGLWKIVKRSAIYDMSSFTFPVGMVAIDQDTLKRYPREYAALAYLLEKSGFPLQGAFPTKRSELEKAIRAQGEAWLHQT